LTVNGVAVGGGGADAFNVYNSTNIVSCLSGSGGTGARNFFAGQCAGLDNTTGCYNNFIGYYAGRANTFGAHNNFIGAASGRINTTGCHNNFFGQCAGFYNSTGRHNFFAGFCTGYCNTTGSCNVFIGAFAGRYVTIGSNNLFFGCCSGTSPQGLANITTQSHTIIMGNNSHTCAQIKIAWTVVSDCRDKCIFGSVPHGRGFLQNIEPIEYAFKDRETGCLTDIQGKRRYGFSAQNVLSAEGDSPVIVSADDPEKLQLTSDYIIPVLVNAVNELSAEVDSLKSRIEALEAR
jgi:hypothetical protein